MDRGGLAAGGAFCQRRKEEQSDDYGTEGMCLGMCLGTALGTSLGNNTGIGVCLGMLIGLAVGTCIKKETQDDDHAKTE